MILLWNSSEMTVSLTLIDGDEQWAYEWKAERNLARDMLGYLRDRLAEHGRSFQDLTGIGVFRGPGSYTGLRIGLTVLNTIASACEIPILGETGKNWEAVALERLNAGQADKIVLPEYGGEAHVTAPRK